MMTQPLRIAAPSCVIPASVADNARFLSGRVEEVGLCLFEAQSCLNYGVDDVPSSLAALPLTWHAHLPVDLPWEAGGAAAAAMALAVLHKVSFLKPHLAVLHPPAHTASVHRVQALKDFRVAWDKHGGIPLLLENIDICDLTDVPADLFSPTGYGVCLDMGHALGFQQHILLDTLLEDSALMQRVQLVHWSAPGQHDQHLPLTLWTQEQRATAQRVARALPQEAVHMIEVFHWAGVEASRPVLQNLWEQ